MKSSCLAQLRSSRLSWLLLALLAWAQLSFAAHQFEHDHSHTEAGETCAVCLQLERSGDALVDAAGQAPSVSVDEFHFTASQPAIRAERFSNYASRASP